MLGKSFDTPSIGPLHPDFPILSRISQSILSKARGKDRLDFAFPTLLQDAIDFVLDPIHTARRTVKELDNVEKTFIGLKVEHYIRDFLDAPKGLRDLKIDGIDVDIKNTVGGTWMIPPETYRGQEPCLLIAIADEDRKCWLGLMLARDEYLGAAEGNRDGKRSVVKKGKENVLWLISGTELPVSRWANVDMQRFRELRTIKGGSRRAAMFFRENPGLVVHRTIVQSLLHDQRDYMKRIRGNGGARDILKTEGISLFSGAYDKKKIKDKGYGTLAGDEFIAVMA